MVCKEEVLSWFKDLESYKRIDVLYELLNMCVPFELRFLGSCMEEIGKHTYQELRGPTINANNVDKLKKDVTLDHGLLEECVRHRVLICLSLLSSRNCTVADWLYKKLLRTEFIDDVVVKEIYKEEVLQSEFLLLYTMALRHPAFTFEQKHDFYNIMSRLIDIREHKNRISSKPSGYDYPPGFGYPKKKTVFDVQPIQYKIAPTVAYTNDANLQQHAHGLPHGNPQMDFFAALWSRPGFACGAPEVPPFPASSISPLVSQAASPNHSRSTSPHRPSMTVRPPPPPPPQIPQVDVVPPPPPIAQLALDTLSQSSLPVYNADLKLPDDELCSMHEEKQILQDLPWPQPSTTVLHPERRVNGFRYPHFPDKRPYLVEQMHAMNLDGENSLHYSNSSSNSSPNQTPPGTPSSIPAAAPHGPGRGTNETKVRSNGMPPFGPASVTSMCGTTSPPPPATFNNCSVPYSYPPPFTPMPQNSHFPPRTPTGCYNCGAFTHIGAECTAQNIEEITQKKTYHLDFSSPLQDGEK